MSKGKTIVTTPDGKAWIDYKEYLQQRDFYRKRHNEAIRHIALGD